MKTPFSALFFIFFLTFSTDVDILAQSPLDTLHQDVQILKKWINNINNENRNLKSSVDSIAKKLDGLNTQFSKSDASIQKTHQKMETDIKESDEKISALNKLLGSTARKWMFGILILVALSGWLFWWLRQRILSGESSVQSQIASTAKTIEETQKSLTEETVKLDTKLSSILESQLKLEQAERMTAPEKPDEEVDHSLALKVADEILRINKNLSNMDAGTKGLKQLASSIKRIEDNFAANGYMMPELLGKAFSPGMKLIVANSIPDENLAAGEEIITRIIKPQVNFKGVMIQAAQVEVSVGQ